MKRYLGTTVIVLGALVGTGCATKKWVRQQTSPIQAKVDEVGEQSKRQGQTLEETRSDVKQVDERAQSGINAAKERAMAAENRANEAATAAQQANTAAQQANEAAKTNQQAIAGLRSSLENVVANIDDYKMQTETSVPFKFDRYALSDEAKQQLDQLAAAAGKAKRFFIAVEGYTDRTGSSQYNEALSRRRADAVVQYLVSTHNLPIYRIHMIGLGEQKPADEGRTRAARAKNRRVEVRLFSADQVATALRAQQ